MKVKIGDKVISVECLAPIIPIDQNMVESRVRIRARLNSERSRTSALRANSGADIDSTLRAGRLGAGLAE